MDFSYQKEEEYTQQLLKQNPQEALWKMAQEDDEDIAVYLLESTFNAKAAGWLENEINFSSSYNGTTLLHEAVKQKKIKLIKTLLFYLKVDPKLQDDNGLTILDLCLNISHEEYSEQKQFLEDLCILLFKSKEAIRVKIDDFRDEEGNTPLMRFINMIPLVNTEQFKEIVNLLIKYGSNINTTNKERNYPLHLLACTHPTEYGQVEAKLLEVAKFFIDSLGAKHSENNKYGLKAREIASVLGYPALAGSLLERSRLKQPSFLFQFFKNYLLTIPNVDPSFKYDCIKHPVDILHLLIMHRINIETIEAYLGTWHKTISKNINTKQSSSIMGYTPLHIAVYYGYFDIVPILLEHGADVNIQDSRGDTPLSALLKLDISREPSLKYIKDQLDEQFKEYMSNQKTQRRRMLIFH
jgi:ankyrin repeat protein